MFSIKNDVDLSTESGIFKKDFNRFRIDFQKVLFEHNEEYLGYLKQRFSNIYNLSTSYICGKKHRYHKKNYPGVMYIY